MWGQLKPGLVFSCGGSNAKKGFFCAGEVFKTHMTLRKTTLNVPKTALPAAVEHGTEEQSQTEGRFIVWPQNAWEPLCSPPKSRSPIPSLPSLSLSLPLFLFLSLLQVQYRQEEILYPGKGARPFCLPCWISKLRTYWETALIKALGSPQERTKKKSVC